jgi:cytochrome P450
MMIVDLIPEQLTPLVATSVIALALCIIVFGLNKKMDERAPTVTVAPTGIWENLVAVGGSEAPFWVLQMSRTLGEMNFMLRMPFVNFYIIGDHKVVRDILKDAASDKPRIIYKAFEGSSAKTMFTSSNNDSYMKALRKSTAHAFSKNEVGRMNEVAAKYVQQFVNGRLKDFAATGQPFDPAHELNYVTFQVICEAAFEYQVTKEEFEEFGHHSEIALKEFIGKSSVNPLRPMFGSFIPEVRRARESGSKLLDFSGRVLQAYRKNPDKSSHNTLIKILNENTSIADNFQRKSEIKDWLTAGHDTTGYSLSNTLTLLALNPKAQDTLREALRTSRMSQTEKPEDCAYFRHVLKESMRVMPVAAEGSVRVTGKPTKLGDGKVLPKGSICFFNQYLVNRNPSVFPDADAFLPERWENPTEEMKVAMAPFALGPRACPGQSLAMSEINSVLPSLLTEFSFELVEEGKRTFFLTLKYQGTGLRAKKL